MSFAHFAWLPTGSTKADDLAVALLELRLQPGHVAELGGAHQHEVPRVREQDGPAIPDPFVEVDLPLRRIRREVRRL
jgi:hypothetical protein